MAATLLAHGAPSADQEWPAAAFVALFAAWIGGLALVLGHWRGTPWGLRDALPVTRGWELLADLALLFVVAGAWRVLGLANVPANYQGDEFAQALEARRFLTGEHVNMFGASLWYGVPFLYMWLGSLAFRVLGPTPTAWRLVTALPASLTPPLLYLAVRVQLDGRSRAARARAARLALLAGAVLSFQHVHLYFSRLGSNQGWDALFVAATLLAILLGCRTGRPQWFYVAGVLAGLGFYFYFALRGIAAMELGLLVALTLRRPELRLRAPAWYLVGVGLAVLPLVAGTAGTDMFLGRATQVAAIPTGGGPRAIAGILGSRALIGVTSLEGRPLKGWYESGAGILVNWLELGLLLLGLIAVRRRGKSLWIYPALLAAIVGTVALFTENPVASQRISSTALPVAVLLALGIDLFAGLATRRRRGLVAVLLVGLVAFADVKHLFLEYLPERQIDFSGLVATELANVLLEHGEIRRVYFCGGGRMGWGSIASLPFRLPNVEGIDTGPPDAGDPPDNLAAGEAVVALPECRQVRDELERRGSRGWTLVYLPPESIRDAVSDYLHTGGRGEFAWTPDGPGPQGPRYRPVFTIYGVPPPDGPAGLAPMLSLDP